jgi:hypothetical protein
VSIPVGVKSEANYAQEDPTPVVARRDRWRKWMWLALGLVVVSQIYFFQELFAALIIFTLVFVIVAVIAGIAYLVGRAGEAGISAAEPAALRGLAVAEAVSKKTFHRPHSTPVP